MEAVNIGGFYDVSTMFEYDRVIGVCLGTSVLLPLGNKLLSYKPKCVVIFDWLIL